MLKKFGLQVKLPALIFLFFYLPLLGISIFVYEYSKMNNENHLVKMIEKKIDAKVEANFRQTTLLKFLNIVRFSEFPEVIALNKALEMTKGNPKNDPDVSLKMKSVLSALNYFKAYMGSLNTFSYIDPKAKIIIKFDKKSPSPEIKTFSEFSKAENQLLNKRMKNIKDEDLYLLNSSALHEKGKNKFLTTYMTGLFNNKNLKALLIFEFEDSNKISKVFPFYSGPDKDGWLVWVDKKEKEIINSSSKLNKVSSIYDILPELPKIEPGLKDQNFWDESGDLIIFRDVISMYKKKLKKMGINFLPEKEGKLIYFYPNSMLSQEINEFRNIILTIIFGQLLLFTPILIFLVFKSKELVSRFSENLNKTNNNIAGSSGVINNFTSILASAQKQNLTRISRSVESVNLVGENFVNFKKTMGDGQRLNEESN
jgi:hypothetical protein